MGVFGYIESTPPQAYYSWLPYGNINTIKGRRYIKFLNGSLSFFIDSYKQSDPVGVIDILEASSAQYMQLMPDGHLKVFEWQLEEWKVIKDLTTLFQSYFYTANHSTTWNTSYSDAQPILFKEANGAQFACGFLCEGNCTEKRKSVVGMNLTDSGNLVLFDDQKSVAWQSFDHPTDCWLLGQKLFMGQKLTSTVVLSNQTNQEGMYSRNQTNQEGMYYLQHTDEGLFAYVKSSSPQAYL
ncbi:putative bulb-type lectin domain-containing protein [Helianthus anomalus]